MSFSHNPFKHVEILHEPHGNYKIYCHGCGGVWGDYTGKVTAEHVFAEMAKHVKESHNRTPEDFEGYST